MKRTVTALYETRAQAEQASAALSAAGLGADIDISDRDASSTEGAHKDGGHLGWLTRWFGGHRDAHIYGEGLRRGHVLLSAKVDELNETRAAEILEAGQPMDLAQHQNTWTAEGWRAPAGGAASQGGAEQTTGAQGGLQSGDRAIDPAPDAATHGYSPSTRVRSYVVTDPVTYSKA